MINDNCVYIIDPICYLAGSSVDMNIAVSVALTELDGESPTEVNLYLHEVDNDQSLFTVTKKTLLAHSHVTGPATGDKVTIPMTYARTFADNTSLGLSIELLDAAGAPKGKGIIAAKNL